MDRNISFRNIPAHNPHCERVFRSGHPDITSPVQGFEYYLSKGAPEPLMLACRTANDITRVYWYINDKFYKAASPTERLFFMPQDGRVKISCTDDKGRNKDVWVIVKTVDL